MAGEDWMRVKRNRKLRKSSLLLLAIFLGSGAEYLYHGEINWFTRLFQQLEKGVVYAQSTLGDSGLQAREPSDGSASLQGRVTKVYDGDSMVISVQGEEVGIRLHGIDAPEWRQAGADQSKRQLQRLVMGKQISVQKINVDPYARIVGVVRVAGTNINLTMVETGHAWWFRRYAGDDLKLKEAEQRAREAGLGLWSDKAPVPPWIWRERKNN